MEPKRPYLDSSVYIAAIKGPDSDEPIGRAELARHILAEADRGRYRIAASTWVAVEVHKRGKLAAAQSDEDLATIDGYLQSGYIDWVEVDFPLAMDARRLARKFKLSPGDAVHLAAAKRAGCDQLLRWDGQWQPGDYEGIEVCDPYWFGQMSLNVPGVTSVLLPTEPEPPDVQSPDAAPG